MSRFSRDRTVRFGALIALTFVSLSVAGCAALGGLGIQAPTFNVVPDQPSELRLMGPSIQNPLGGASVRLFARVENPNPVGITLTSVAGTLRLEGQEAADVDFPVGVPLQAGGSTVVPLDLTIGFANLAELADVIRRAVGRGEVGFSLRGTATVDAGVLGQPTFGPMTLLEGSLDAGP
ncbi:MAG: Water stress and hypersensitive response domain-containing protein [Gemmatimonas sp.]|nr:Water stress and hypersensitive response domain-containing protein [Gemmatimonas sp.]